MINHFKNLFLCILVLYPAHIIFAPEEEMQSPTHTSEETEPGLNHMDSNEPTDEEMKQDSPSIMTRIKNMFSTTGTKSSTTSTQKPGTVKLDQPTSTTTQPSNAPDASTNLNASAPKTDITKMSSSSFSDMFQPIVDHIKNIGTKISNVFKSSSSSTPKDMPEEGVIDMLPATRLVESQPKSIPTTAATSSTTESKSAITDTKPTTETKPLSQDELLANRKKYWSDEKLQAQGILPGSDAANRLISGNTNSPAATATKTTAPTASKPNLSTTEISTFVDQKLPSMSEMKSGDIEDTVNGLLKAKNDLLTSQTPALQGARLLEIKAQNTTSDPKAQLDAQKELDVITPTIETARTTAAQNATNVVKTLNTKLPSSKIAISIVSDDSGSKYDHPSDLSAIKVKVLDLSKLDTKQPIEQQLQKLVGPNAKLTDTEKESLVKTIKDRVISNSAADLAADVNDQADTAESLTELLTKEKSPYAKEIVAKVQQLIPSLKQS